MKQKLKSIRQLKTQLWERCKQLVRERDKGVCQACGATGLEGSNAQTSHLIPSSVCGAFLRYDLRNLYLCCMRCNIHLGGNLAELYRAVLARRGQTFVDELYRDKRRITKLDRLF